MMGLSTIIGKKNNYRPKTDAPFKDNYTINDGLYWVMWVVQGGYTNPNGDSATVISYLIQAGVHAGNINLHAGRLL